MKTTTKAILITACLLALQLNVVLAQTFTVKTWKVTVKGSSSLHDWESTVEKMEAKGSLLLTNNTLSDVRDVIVKIPVKSIKSPKGKMMDNKTWEAFNSEKNPTITFAMTGKKINAARSSMDLSGTLTMAGVAKPIELTLIYKVLPGGEIQFTGTKTLVMTDFKMDPPTAMMGTIKVGNEVTVTLELLLSANNSL